MAAYTRKQLQRLLELAIQPATERAAGAKTLKIGRVWFNLEEVACCARHVRELFEAMLGKGEYTWPFGAVDANHMGDELRRAGYQVPDGHPIQPGDILVWTYEPWGHVVLYLGDVYGDGRKLVAENTSARRGWPQKPGTKISRLSSVHGGKGFAAYRLFPTEKAA